MSIPTESVVIPAQVDLLSRGADLVCVWRNEDDGLTFRATGVGDPFYIKWTPRVLESSLLDEAERMRWASRWITVPVVLDAGADETHEWLVTAALDGSSAVDPRWSDDPATAVRAVGEGLRAMHDALPVEDCPWDWGVPSRIANAERRGIVVPASLRTPPPVDTLVVAHGDACLPNTLLAADGRWLAHVDLAALGVADRWADIAVASMSTEWNCGPGWEDALIEAYGLEPDRERLAYYRDLWNAT
ncbi:aminoglycoside 3'-phosphotransferase [Microbacterium sp. p3-SID336]|uniref:aminoglycoside 3'-phosphotransferase n=1 Tax=Microbacterium sp. p3-SID336 TaxID=2916212 RepID=UPI0021A95CA0|nr:aminoglycoside 3'-phosphotransferase [Microbacterium sp. p3-SID336]MCT1476866.1 aminoglycoside 3'-phosphotransferase [Microbacterium sp. p3-SID336]